MKPIVESTSPLMKPSLILFYGFSASLLLVIADYFAGPFIQFPISYLLPVALVAWFHGRRWGLIFAVVLPLVRFYFSAVLWTVPWTLADAGINAVIRIVVLSLFALIIDRTAIQSRAMSKQMSLLEGLLPICSHCKKIRDENNNWQELEKYIHDRSGATFTHGICPECMKEYWGDIAPR